MTVEPTETQPDSPAGEPNGTPEGKETGGNREARYRVERNEAREALSAAEARIAQMQRAEIERLAGESLSHPTDVFTFSGNELADYLTEDGSVDPEKVAADVVAILAERPGLKPLPRLVDPSQGLGGGAPLPQAPTWSALLS